MAREKEQQAFEAFLRAHPSLASRIASWQVQEDPNAFPDVLVTMKNGERRGYELGELLSEQQIAHSKKCDQVDSKIRDAIRPQPEHRPLHSHCGLLFPNYGNSRFDQRDREWFRKELFQLIHETDQQWPAERHWQSPQGYHCRDLAAFPTLAKYLVEVWFVPQVMGRSVKEPRPLGVPWIHVRSRAGSCSGEALRGLCQRLLRRKSNATGIRLSIRCIW